MSASKVGRLALAGRDTFTWQAGKLLWLEAPGREPGTCRRLRRHGRWSTATEATTVTDDETDT